MQFGALETGKSFNFSTPNDTSVSSLFSLLCIIVVRRIVPFRFCNISQSLCLNFFFTRVARVCKTQNVLLLFVSHKQHKMKTSAEITLGNTLHSKFISTSQHCSCSSLDFKSLLQCRI